MFVEADLELVAETEHVARIVQHGDAGGGRLDTVRAPHDQRRAHLLFEQAYPAACSGQCDVEALGRLAHAAQLASRQEHPEALQIVMEHGPTLRRYG
ncbi:MAG: hypothetical protein WB774_12450 [Xanthobacteraceae bacterium]